MTNGWGRSLRQATAEHFGIEYDEMNERHSLVFDPFETGKIGFDEYLKRTVFYKKRTFTVEEVKRFVFDSVKPFQETIDFIKDLKQAFDLKIGLLSNEGRDLAVDRIRRFHLTDFADFFIISSFVHFRKPDQDIYKLAIDVAQIPPSEIVYIDDRELLVEVGKSMGLQGIHHTSLESTKEALKMFFPQAALKP